MNTDRGSVFNDGTAVNGPHAAIRLGSCGGRVVSGMVFAGVVTRRGVSRRVVSKSSWGTASLGGSLLAEVVPLLPSCEETVSIELTQPIETIPINLPVFERPGPMVTSFLKGVTGEGEEGEGVDEALVGDEVAVTRWSSLL